MAGDSPVSPGPPPDPRPPSPSPQPSEPSPQPSEPSPGSPGEPPQLYQPSRQAHEPSPQPYEPSALELDRRAFRRSRARRSTLGAIASTFLFAALVWVTLTNAPGWPRVQMTFFDVTTARESLGPILRGLLVNIEVLAVGGALVFVCGLLIALARTVRGAVFAPLRLLAVAYVDVFRGMPLIIVLYLVGFGVPALRLSGVPTSPFVLGTAAVVLTYSAYVAEVFRAGIESVHPSQRAAARSLGLNHRQTTRIVVLPQAIRTVTPALLNDFVALQKDVGLISLLGVTDAVRAAQILAGQSFNFTPYVVAGLLFVLLAIPSARLADRYTVRALRRQQAGGLL